MKKCENWRICCNRCWGENGEAIGDATICLSCVGGSNMKVINTPVPKYRIGEQLVNKNSHHVERVISITIFPDSVVYHWNVGCAREEELIPMGEEYIQYLLDEENKRHEKEIKRINELL